MNRPVVEPASEQATTVHQALVVALRARRAAEHTAAGLLVEMDADSLFLELGYASLKDYAYAAHDLSPRQTVALLQIGRALPDLPVLDAAFKAGELPYTKVREVVRIATPDNEAAWTARAQERTSRELEAEVAASCVGEAPPERTVRALRPQRTRLVIELDTTDFDLVHTAIAAMREATHVGRDELDDGALLAELARRAIHDAAAGEAPTGERYRTIIQLCPGCAEVHAPHAEVGESAIAEATCDSEVVEMVDPARRGHASRTIPPAVRRAVMARDGHRCRVPGCSNRVWLDLHHLEHFADGGGHTEGNLVCTCSVHHRVLHAGLLAIWVDGDQLMTAFADGRVEAQDLDPGCPRGSAPPEADVASEVCASGGSGWVAP